MNTTLSAIGQGRSWNLIHKLGEGDAGEVYLVESLLDRKQAILKKPVRGAFSSDIIRQSVQIRNEGLLLRSLNGLRANPTRKSDLPKIEVRVPDLIDMSQVGTEFSDRFFIIIEQAPGYDLGYLARLAHQGHYEEDENRPASEPKLLQAIAVSGIVPAFILLRAMAGVLRLFDALHNPSRIDQVGDKSGIVWNDVKPDHIFFDPSSGRITIIDWGNAQVLEADGYNKERRISRADDYTQFIRTFGSFLKGTNPALLADLSWPSISTSVLSYTDLLRPLRKKIGDLFNRYSQELKESRQEEITLLTKDQPEANQIRALLDTQQNILAFGELPDYAGAERFCTRLASKLIHHKNLAEFTNLFDLSCQVHADNLPKWQALSDIARVAATENGKTQPIFLKALAAGLVEDWASAQWDLLAATADQPEPAWWDDISALIRQIGLSIQDDYLPPLVVLKRLILLMQSDLQKQRDRLQAATQTETPRKDPLERADTLIRLLKEEIAVKWEEVEPVPPDSGLGYNDLDRLLEEIDSYFPGILAPLGNALEQPRALVRDILAAWDGREYDSARRGLRRLLLWDPDRRRVLTADRALIKAPRWLKKIYGGPQNGQILTDFSAEVEFTGQELRSQIGPAVWLDLILDLCGQLRRGRKINALLVENPELASLVPWLEALEPRRYIPQQPVRPIQFERKTTSQLPGPTVRGIQENSIGVDQDMLLAEPLDTWAPEARGSSARTFIGFLRDPDGSLRQVAIKLMRPDQIDYALPLFREEAQALNIMRDIPGLTPMLECGFIRLDEGSTMPPDNRPRDARALTGLVQRFAPDQLPGFLSNLETKARLDWLPYLALPKLDNQENLMWLCDAGYTRGRFLPIEAGIRLATQICDILHVAHTRNIVYRDHKLLHYYWSELYNGVFIIDWNVARYRPDGLSQAEIQFDLVQFGARALHHIFTGRVAPGALADGPNRVEEIETAANAYRVQWTYDDQRLPPGIKSTLEQLLDGGYSNASQLRTDLHQTYLELVEESESQEIN